MKVKDCIDEAVGDWINGSEIMPFVVDRNATIIEISNGNVIHLSDKHGKLHIKSDYRLYTNEILKLAVIGITVNDFYDKEILI